MTTTAAATKIIKADFYDDRAWDHLCRAGAYRFSIRIAKQGGCDANGLRILREMMRRNATEAVVAARRAKARTLRIAA